MYKIQANVSGTKSIDVTEKHLKTIEKYSLLQGLLDSSGIVDDSIVEKLRLQVRSLLESDGNMDNDLLDLCMDVIYDKHMKAHGLGKLINLYENRKHRE